MQDWNDEPGAGTISILCT